MIVDQPHQTGCKYLVIGASGLLGGHLMAELSRSTSVRGTYHRRSVPGCLSCDLAEPNAVRTALRAASADVIIHVGGMTRPDDCETNRAAASRVNVEGMRSLIDYAEDAKMIFFSTDYVFDGARGGYGEDDQPSPINHYGRTKLAAERLLLDNRPDSLVVRVSGLFGTRTWYEEFMGSFGRENELRASAQHSSSHTYIYDISRHLPSLLGMSGVVHFVGPSVYSRAEFASVVVRSLSITAEVVAVTGDAAYRTTPRPRDSSLLSSRLTLPMTSVPTGLSELKQTLAATSTARFP